MTLATHHNLHNQFPEDGEILHELKLNDAHFRYLANRRDDVSKAIYRAETEIEPISDEHLEALKKERLFLLDGIAALIARQRG